MALALLVGTEAEALIGEDDCVGVVVLFVLFCVEVDDLVG